MPTHGPLRLGSAIRDQDVIGQNLHRRMLEALHIALGGRLVVVSVNLPPTESNNVMTTWVLPQDKIELLARLHKKQWHEATRNLLMQWNDLKANRPPSGADAYLARPPLD